jgi:hypothetical protein
LFRSIRDELVATVFEISSICRDQRCGVQAVPEHFESIRYTGVEFLCFRAHRRKTSLQLSRKATDLSVAFLIYAGGASETVGGTELDRFRLG